MDDAWETLVELGLPWGAIRPPPRGPLDPERARAALRAVAASGPPAPARVAPLLAWLKAWRHHWPDSFDDALGPDGHAIVARLEAALDDPNRYLKLRRVAIENLAGIL